MRGFFLILLLTCVSFGPLTASAPSLPELRSTALQSKAPGDLLRLAEAYSNLPDSAEKYLELAKNAFRQPEGSEQVRMALLQSSIYIRINQIRQVDSLLRISDSLNVRFRSGYEVQISGEQAIAAIKKGELDLAEQLLDRCFREARKSKKTDLILRAYLYRAILCFRKQTLHQGLSYMYKAEALLEDYTPLPLKGKIYNNLGTLNMHLGNYETGFCYLQEAIEVKKDYGDLAGESKSLINLAIIYNRQSQPEKATAATLRAEKVFRKLGDKEMIARSQMNQGMYLRRSGRRQAALKKYKASFAFLANNGFHYDATSVCNSLALLYQDLGQYHLALQHFYRALRMARNHNLGDLQLLCHSNLARILWQNGFEALAIEHADQSLELSKQSEEVIVQMQQYREMGRFYLQNGKIEAAKACFSSLADLAPADGKNPMAVAALSGLAEIDLVEKNPEKALQKGEQALFLAKSQDWSENLLPTYQVLAKSHQASGNNTKAAFYAKKWLQSAKEGQLWVELPDAYLLNAKLARKNGQFQKSLDYLERGSHLRDSLNGSQKQKTLALLQGFFDHREKQYRIKELSQDLEREQLARERDLYKAWQNNLLLLLIAGTVLFSALAVILFLRKKSLQRKSENLQLKLQASKEREEMAADMRAMQQQALQTRMNPHFTFNCLNSIQALVLENDQEMASIYLSRFGKLVRQAFEYSKESRISLEDELDFLRLYCELENLRFDGKVEVQFGVSPALNPECENLPPLLIQPLIENAFQHGFRKRRHGSRIDIKVRSEDNFLIWTIEDNGGGLRTPKPSKMGIRRKPSGLAHAQQRIRLLLEDALLNCEDCFSLSNVHNAQGEVTGSRAELRIPREGWTGAQASSPLSTIHPADPTIR